LINLKYRYSAISKGCNWSWMPHRKMLSTRHDFSWNKLFFDSRNKTFIVFLSAEVIKISLHDSKSFEHLHRTWKLPSYVCGIAQRSHKFVNGLCNCVLFFTCWCTDDNWEIIILINRAYTISIHWYIGKFKRLNFSTMKDYQTKF
jgi:hypothetical protein